METETNLKIIGVSRKSQNGDIIDNRGFDLEYDGNYADINSFVNNKNKHVRLNNEELLELFNKPVSNIPLEYRLMNDFNTSSKMLNLMNTPLTVMKLNYSKSKSQSRNKSRSKTKSKSKKSTFKNYAYPLLDRIKVPKIEMENLIPYGLMNTKLKSKASASKSKKNISKSKSKTKSIPRYTYKSNSKYKSMRKSKPKTKYVNFMTNNTNSLDNLLSPIRSPSRASNQFIRRATPYVRNTASKISSFIPQSKSNSNYKSLTNPNSIERFSQQQEPQDLYSLRENNQIMK